MYPQTRTFEIKGNKNRARVVILDGKGTVLDVWKGPVGRKFYDHSFKEFLERNGSSHLLNQIHQALEYKKQ